MDLLAVQGTLKSLLQHHSSKASILRCSAFFIVQLSQQQVLSNELALHIRWPKYWSFSFSISPSNEYSGLISFKIDWFDLLAVQGTLESLLQQHNSEASIHWHSTFCWRRQWLPTPVLLPGKIPWMEEPGGLQSMGFPRQEYWSGLPFPSPGDLPNPRDRI